MTQAKTIALCTVGTTGDVEPYLALGRALAARGHRVRVLSHRLHAPRFEAAGLDFRPVAAEIDRGELNRVLDQICEEERDPLRQFTRLVHDVFLEGAEARLAAYLEAAADVELGVCHCFDHLGQEAMRRHQRPWASVFMMPDVIASAEAPPFPLPRLGRFFARAAWLAAARRAEEAYAPVRARLAATGVEIRELGIAGEVSPTLNLIAASPQLISVRGDWPKSFAVTGPWWSAEEEPALGPELTRFLQAHPAPIVVTFGSMGGGRGAETAEILRSALAAVGRPAVVQAGYQGLQVEGERVLSIGFAPHARLFSAAGCVVHHAGAGTAHAACRAGVPSLTVPHMFDQYYWAGMLERAGVAPKPLWRTQLEPRRLADALRRLLANDASRTRARALAARMREERGVERAVELIESMRPG